MAKFEKGQSGNLSGKPKGAKNLITATVKEILTGVVQKHLTPIKLGRDLKQLKPKDRLEIIIKLAGFIVPKPTEGTLSVSFLENLDPEKANEVYNIIFNKKPDETDNRTCENNAE